MAAKKPVNAEEMFKFIDNDNISSEKITAPRYSYWRSVFRVFFRKKMNIVLIVLFILILMGSFILPIFWQYDAFENITRAETFNLSPGEAINILGSDIKWILGTGATGNSIMYGIFSSARTSIQLAVICAAINMTIGVIVGAVWGYSKKVDTVMLVVYNIIANVPYILLISVLVYIIGSVSGLVFALTAIGWA